MQITPRERERWQAELRDIRARRPSHLPRLSLRREAEIIASRLGYSKSLVGTIRNYLLGLSA